MTHITRLVIGFFSLSACSSGTAPGNDNDAAVDASLCGDDEDCPPGQSCRVGACAASLDGGGIEADAPVDAPAGAGPDILLSPDTLDFGPVPLLGEVELELEVHNVGDADLVLSSIEIDEDDPNVEFSSAPAGIVDVTVPAGEMTIVTVTLRPNDGGLDTGILKISSNDPDEAIALVDLISELKGTPRLCVCPLLATGLDPLDPANCGGDDEIDFDGVTWGTTATRDLAVWNCADGENPNRPLEIASALVTSDTAYADLFDEWAYEIDDGGEEAAAAFPVVLAPVDPEAPDLLYVRVTFLAEDDGGAVPAEALRFISNDDGEDGSERDVPIVGAIVGCPPGFVDDNDDPDDGCEAPCAATGEEECDDADNDCDGFTDEGDNDCGGVCALPGVLGVPCDGADDDQCVEGSWVCDGANSAACNDFSATNAEACNGDDDDCDGDIDEAPEGAGNACGGVCTLSPEPGTLCDGVDGDLCTEGAWQCEGMNTTICDDLTDDVEEICNAFDDDCDGTADEGGNACGGVCELTTAPGPTCDGDDGDACAEGTLTCSGLNAVVCNDFTGTIAETCNSADDDCDGVTDEGFDVGGLCDGSDVDLCQEGTFGCSGGVAVCSDATGASVEVCGGGDEDCDGSTDEGSNACGGACTLAPAFGGPCDGPDGDSCVEGTWACSGWNTTVCSDSTSTTTEVCNGADDDCNGVPDDGIPSGAPCDGSDGDYCNEGTMNCSFGTSTCSDTTGTNSETCGGGDEDCDGSTDEGSNACGGACTLSYTPGVTCDGGDSDFCNEGSWGCSGWNAVTCSDTSGDNVEICDGIDQDCDGNISEGSCSLPNASSTCSGGTCVVTGCYSGYSDCTGGAGCETSTGTASSCGSCSGTTNCTTLANTSGEYCSGGSCAFSGCNEGWAECNNAISDGCERDIDDNYGSCGGAIYMGSIAGDTNTASGPISTSSYGEGWWSFQLREDVSAFSGTYISARVWLDVPSGVDYDLEVRCPNCAGGVVYGQAGTGTDEFVYVSWDDDFGVSDTQNVYVRVYWWSGSTLDCGSWTLQAWGNYADSSRDCDG
ncbi:MAG: choice-of-anchor D domain-containing protein [Myxococcota bacterium]